MPHAPGLWPPGRRALGARVRHLDAPAVYSLAAEAPTAAERAHASGGHHRVHGLGTADSLQLAAALAVAGDEPARLAFVCLDHRLATASAREGLSVVGAVTS